MTRTLISLFAIAQLWLVATLPATLAAQDIQERLKRNVETHRLFGSEHPGLYKHPASITELSNGDWYIAYYGGSGEYSSDTAVYGSRRRMTAPGQMSWSEPQIIADTPFQSDGNPVVWQAPDGVVWLFYVNLDGDTWSDARVKAKISTDGASTWSDSFVLSDERGSMVRGKPIVLHDGNYLLPMYHETGDDREKMGTDTTSYFLRYNPANQKWTATNRIHSPLGNLQPQVVQLTNDHLVCYMRRGGGYGPESSGFIQRAESLDGGFTWSDASDTDFKNPNSAVDALRLQNGHIALVYNDHMYERSPLSIAISTDQAKTFPHRRNIGGGDNTFAYPYMIQVDDGRILVLYTTNARTTIMLAEFPEAAIVHE